MSKKMKVNSSLGNEILNVYNKLKHTINQVPQALCTVKEIDKAGEKISITDLISYQIGWGNLLIGWYKAGLLDRIPEMPGEGFSKWNYAAIAQYFYRKYHGEDWKKQQLLFNKTVFMILDIVEKEYREENLDKIDVWSWCTLPSGKKWPLSKWVKVNTVSPYKKATTQIRNFLKHNLNGFSNVQLRACLKLQ